MALEVDVLARRIQVRHRAAGYLRLELPGEICHAAAGLAMEAALRRVAGVYRVAFDAAARRLAVDFDDKLCTAADVARALRACLGEMPEVAEAAAASTTLRDPSRLMPRLDSPAARTMNARCTTTSAPATRCSTAARSRLSPWW